MLLMHQNVYILTISDKRQQDNITIAGICPDFMLNNVLFNGKLIVFVLVVTWFLCWEGNSVTAPPVVCICTNMFHCLHAYETFRQDTTETNLLWYGKELHFILDSIVLAGGIS